jgi:predicted ATP-grasp superfamily ATP-dependent carboligase
MKSKLITWENPVPSDLKDPVLICSLDGWIDAGYGAQAAMGSLKQQIRTHRLLAFDTDELIDFRARRPTMRLINGVNTELRWPRLQIRHGKDAVGADVLVLTGPEPDFRWRGFTETIMELVDTLGIRMCVNLGAFPAPAPHTRPVTLGSTATTQDLAERIGFIDASFEIPAGVSAAIERAFAEQNKPAIGVWARVPHYVSQMLYPAASAAILDGVARVTGLVLDTDELHRNARIVSAQIDSLVANNPEHIDMVRQLESQVDSERQPQTTMLSDGLPLPTGDELAAELERFLRDQ